MVIQNFQFNHIQLGLTYPQADGLTKEMIKIYLEGWYFNNGTEDIHVTKYIIAEETHKEEGIHFHVYVRLDNKLRAREPRIFDIFVEATGRLYHPHIEKIRGLKNMIRYITKEDDHPLSNFEWKKTDANGIDWDAIYSVDYSNAEAFLDAFQAKYPAYFTNHYIPLKQIAYDRYERRKEIYNPTYLQFNNVPHVCLVWETLHLRGNRERPLSLVLIGISRTGKTEWARSLGRHMYFNMYFNLDLWDEEAEYAVFDDMDADTEKPLEKYFPSWKQFFGAQKEFTVTDKYKKKRNVKWGKPIIFISNNEINCSVSTSNYIRMNSVRCNVYNNFY